MNKVDPWELLAELREHFGSCDGIPDHLWDITDAALAGRQNWITDNAETGFTFRGGYIETPDGSRWWSENLLKRVETERNDAYAKAEHLQLQLEGALDRSKEGEWMARALDAEQELAEAKSAAIEAARSLK